MGTDVPWETPNVMKLAERGMNFTQAYSPAPTCAPSRGAILSGQHPCLTHLTHVSGGALPTQKTTYKLVSPFYKTHIPDNALTIARALSENGYRSGQIGKWHLGEFEEQVPVGIGFDYEFRDRGVHRGMDDRTMGFATDDPSDKYVLSEEKYPPVSAENPDGISYPKDLVTDSAIAFIGGSGDQPFFLYLAHWLVHYPIVTRNEKLLAYYCDKLGIDFPEEDTPVTTPGQNNPYYGAMVSTMDWSLGRIVDYLEATDDPRNPGKKLIETTYIIMTSDNGGCEMHSTEVITDNYPLDEGKKHAQEGGVRVPMVVAGPTIAAGTEFHGCVNQLDYFPTLLAYSNTTIDQAAADKLWGLDISSIFDGTEMVVKELDGTPRKNLFWHFPHNGDESQQSALRQGDYKLYKNLLDGSYELYRLYDGLETVDLEEQFDIAADAENAEVLADMIENLEAHLLENNAEYPSLNPIYTGDSPGKDDVPVIVSHSHDMSSREVSVQVEDGKTDLRSAYLLVLRTETGVTSSYEKVEAVVSADKRSVSAVLPEDRDEYVFVLIDANNFMVISDSYEMLVIESAQSMLIEAVENTDYGYEETAVLISEVQLAPDSTATYRISADVIPQSGRSIVSSPDNSSWGVANDDQGTLNNKNYIFWANTADTVSIGNLQVVDFSANGGDLTVNNINNLHFESINFKNSGSADKDAVGITAEGTSYNLANITSVELKDDLNTSYYPIGFSLYNAESASSSANKWSVGSIEVGVDFGIQTSNKKVSDTEHSSCELVFEPNPAKTHITLDISPLSTMIYDLNGKLMMECGYGQDVIDISNLASGVYIAKVSSIKGKHYVNRLIKE